MNDITLSLVTGTRNRPENFRRLMNSVIVYTTVPWELIVSDASDAPIESCFKVALPCNVTIIPERPRLGFTKGYNRAFREAKGKWVVWLNDDAEVLENYDLAAIAFMEKHLRIGLGAIYYKDHTNRSAGNRFAVNTYMDMIYANFGIISREFGEKLGWFDEEFTMYGSDNAFALQVLKAGRGVAAIPGSKMTHHCVNDQERKNNQVGRLASVTLLQEKYGKIKQQLRQTYRRLNVPAPLVMP